MKRTVPQQKDMAGKIETKPKRVGRLKTRNSMGLVRRIARREGLKPSKRRRRKVRPAWLKPRLYRMTLATPRTHYDERSGKARRYEAHLKIARPGSVDTVRRRLADRGIPVLQRTVQQVFGVRVSKGDIEARIERLEPATKIEGDIQIEMRAIEFRGRESRAISLPSKVVSYAKRR